MQYRLLAVLILVPLILVASGQVNAQRTRETGVPVVISLTEAEVNTLVANALAQSRSPLLLNPQVDLQPGQIVVSGQYQRQDGSTVNGSITVVPSVQNGQVTAQITQASIAGWNASDQRISQFNQALARGLMLAAERNPSDVTVQSITITDTTLHIVLRVQRQQ